MKRKIFIGLAIAVATLFLVWPVVSEENYDYDIAFRGGTLYLGGLEMGGVGDVAVRGDEIIAVGEAPGRARREINASGLIVSPGFIDLHTHSDMPFVFLKGLPLPKSIKTNMNYITQGVTTVVTGNCGTGFSSRDAVVKYFERINRIRFGSNVIHLIPHGDIRLNAMGAAQAEREDQKPTPEEMQKMKDILAAGLESGGWGMSTGLIYDPGARADTEELVELNKVVAEHGGLYATHIREEGPDPERTMAAFREAIEIGERAGTRVQISHIKCSGKKVHGMSGKVIELIEAARARGVKVSADQYPYIAGSSTLSTLVPADKRDGNHVLKKHCTPEGRAKLYDEVADILANDHAPEEVLISLYPWKPWLQGKTLVEIAKKRGEDPVNVAMDLACGPIGAGIYFTMIEGDLKNFMKNDWVSTASDGSVFFKSIGKAHPRFYGTFPRKIRRYVYEQKVITLPFALRSMTELPAKSFGIPKRGKLAPGNYADIVVFNPDTIRDLATWENPNVYSEGIEYLLVNGVLTINDGKYTGKRGGKTLRRGKD